jgi:hypothetical protein
MSQGDLVWYGRAGVWLGSALLFIMAFLGIVLPVVTVASVLSVVFGAVLLVYSIPFGPQSGKNTRDTGGTVNGFS